MKPCLLIPIYEHPATIESVVDALAYLEIPALVIDDGSGPETVRALERCEKRHSWLRVVRHARNRGRGAALQTGYREALRAGFTHALQLDADAQHDASDAPRFLAAATLRPDALVLGEPRFGPEAPRARRWGRSISKFWVWVETGSFAIADPLCGYRCMPLAETVGVLDRTACGNHMDFDPEIAVRLHWAGVPIVNVPTRVRYFADGISHFDLLRDNWRISWAHTRLVIGMLVRLPRRLLAPGVSR